MTRDAGALRGRIGGGAFGESPGAKHTIVYKGGPKESWAITGREDLPPDLEATPGYLHLDDRDVELLDPVDGAPRVELGVPGFCGEYSGAGLELSFDQMEDGFLGVDDVMETISSLRSVAWAACDRMYYEPRQKRVQRLLQTYENKTKTPLAELNKLLAALAATTVEDRFCGGDPTVRWINCGERPKDEQMPRRERLDMLEMRGRPLDEERFRLGMASFVDMKREERGSSLKARQEKRAPNVWLVEIRAGGALRALQGSTTTAENLRHTTAGAAVDAVDVRAIEWEPLALSLLAKEQDAVTRHVLEKRFSQWRAAMEKGAAAAGDAIEKAKAAEEDWRKKVLEPDAAGIRAAFEAIETPSAGEACAKVESGLAEAVKRRAPADWKAATALLAEPGFDVMLQARHACHVAEKRSEAARIEKELLAAFGKKGWGPRVTAYRALDEWRGNPADPFDPPSPFTVRSVKEKGDAVEIGFEAHAWEERRQSCVETNKIDGITWEGKIVYRVECTSLPPIKHTEPLPPMTLPKAAAGSVKKGYVLAIGDDAGKPTLLYGWASKKADAPLTLFLGAALGK